MNEAEFARHILASVKDALVKVQDNQVIGTPNVIRMQGIGTKKPVKVGQLFGCDVYADPWLPADTWCVVQATSEFQDGKRGGL